MTSANVQVTKRKAPVVVRRLCGSSPSLSRRFSAKRVRERESLWRKDKNQNTPQSRLYQSPFLANNCGWFPEA